MFKIQVLLYIWIVLENIVPASLSNVSEVMIGVFAPEHRINWYYFSRSHLFIIRSAVIQ